MSAAARPAGDPEAPELIPLALLDGYKVRWSRETVARDIVQNFFDEVADFREVTIDVDAGRGVVEVRGPSSFDLEYLRYIGATTKQRRRAAGGFGEGFKVCALVLVRDFHCKVTAGSRRWEIQPVLRPMKLGRELCYEVRTLPAAEAHPGSFVRIEGADARLCEIFAGAKELFRHPDNPRLARPIFSDEEAGIGVFEGRENAVGEIYYRRQLRGTLRFPLGGALTFAFDARLDALEGDRDRRDLALAFPLVTAVAQRLPDATLEDLIRRLRKYWEHGGKVLSALLAEGKRRGLRMSFPRRWLARVKRQYFLERYVERAGFHLGVERLAGVGMPTLVDRFAGAEEPRPPTLVEAARMKVARDLYTLLAGEDPIFNRFRVQDVDNRGGDFRRGSCVVAAESLAAPFAEGIAPCLARLACTNGLRARRNADRLTALLEGAVRRAGTLDPFAARWQAAAADPSGEGVDVASFTDDEPDGNYATPRVTVTVLAPPGFPPVAEFTARLRRICAEERMLATVTEPGVDGPRAAAHEYARGIPSVWIGGTEVDPPRGRRPSFTVRTFPAPGGGRAIFPDDDAIRAALRVERKLNRGKMFDIGRRHKRMDRGRDALYGWLGANEPEELFDIVRRRSISGANDREHDKYPPQVGMGFGQLVQTIALRELTAKPLDFDTMDETALALVQVAAGQVASVLGPILRSAPSLGQDTPAGNVALESILDRARRQIEAGVPDEAAFAEISAAAPAVAAICEGFDSAPLDAICARACVEEAIAELWARGGEIGAARARFDEAVSFAAVRHEERDADGNPPHCFSLREALRARYGRPPLVVPKPKTVEIAVRAAWEEARAAGLDEIEATRRCLAAAAAAR